MFGWFHECNQVYIRASNTSLKKNSKPLKIDHYFQTKN